MNDFCMYCTGHVAGEVKTCDDKNCPFYNDRAANLPYQDKRRQG